MLNPCTYKKIYNEGILAAHMDVNINSCRYGGEKKEAWLLGYKSLEDDEE